MNPSTDIMNEEMKEHLRAALAENIREDGRGLTDFREVSVEYGVTGTAEGSARVCLGGTEVIAGVKLSIGTPYGDSPEDGVVMVGAELLPMSSPEYELGPPGIKSIEISRVADRGMRESKAIDTKKLCIEAGEKVWIVSVDVCSINDCGNLQDAVALATLGALQDARFPEVDENGRVDYKKKTKDKLPLQKLPIAITVIKSGDHLFVDPTEKEELVIDARVTFTIDAKNLITSLQKGGADPLLTEEVNAMADIAVKKATELRKHLKK